MTMLHSFQMIYEEVLTQYGVANVITDESNFFFILESPHIQELIYHVPVAGSSGASMSKHLFGENYNKPLGRLVKKNLEEHKDRPSLNKIGLINVCNIPMQKAAYKNPSLILQYEDFFNALEAIRSNNQTDRFREESWNVAQEMVVLNIRESLLKIKDRSCTIVPCGRFAQKFFRLANVHSDHWTVIDHVPHPSYNSWSRACYKQAIEEVKHAFSRT